MEGSPHRVLVEQQMEQEDAGHERKQHHDAERRGAPISAATRIRACSLVITIVTSLEFRAFQIELLIQWKTLDPERNTE